MSDEVTQPAAPPINEDVVEKLMLVIGRVFEDISPTVWDTRGWDIAKLEKDRWMNDASAQELAHAFQRTLEKERLANTRNWQVYRSNGGRHKALKSDGTAVPTDIEEEDLEAETTLKTSQNQDFVTGGNMSGEQIILHTTYGKVITDVEHILSFRLFQQDVLRYTKMVYPSRYKKLHEKNVAKWLEKVSFSSTDSHDDSLPINLFSHLFPNFLELAETEEPRFERALSQKHNAVRIGNDIFFTMATLIEWLRKAAPDHRFSRGEIKTFLRELYGLRFTDSTRLLNYRVQRVTLNATDSGYVEPKPEPEPEATTLPPINTGTGTNNPQEIQHDSGSGKDDPTHQGHHDTRGTGTSPPEHAHHVVLEDNRSGSEGTPSDEALPF